MEERDIRSYVECYDGGNGNVKLRRLVSYDSKIKARYVRFEVLESDDAGFVPGPNWLPSRTDSLWCLVISRIWKIGCLLISRSVTRHQPEACV